MILPFSCPVTEFDQTDARLKASAVRLLVIFDILTGNSKGMAPLR